MAFKRSSTLKYRKLKSGGYLVEMTWRCDTDIKGKDCWVETPRGGRATLNPDGLLTVKAGYLWDGCSGPVIDRKTNMKAGLAHDALYHMCRAGKLSAKELRDECDVLFRELVKEEGGFAFTAWLDYLGLRAGAGYAAKKQPEISDKVYEV